MTERKPAGVSWESWVEEQIRDAMERGEFDDLPGARKPLPGIDRPHDDMWWVREKLKRENLSFLPPALAVRKELEEVLDPSILTIGFARRFATYKRSALLFTDLDRLARILWDEARPMQIIFAGKAHPADRPGQGVIQDIFGR